MLRCDALPRVGLERLHRQRNAVTALRQLDDPGGHIVAHLEHFVGVGHPGALELGDVNEPLDAAEIDEGAEVGERNHLAGDRRADGEGGAGFGGLVRLLVTQYRGVRDHEPVTLFLDPEDAKEEALIEVLGRLLGGSQFHRGAWAEGGDAVHHDMETALVPADDLALDIGLIGDRRLDDFARHERELLRRRHDELVDRLAGGTMALLARLAVALLALGARAGLLGPRPGGGLGRRIAGWSRLRGGGALGGGLYGNFRRGRSRFRGGLRGIGRVRGRFRRDLAVLELGHAGLRHASFGAIPAKASGEARLARRIAQEARGAKRSRNGRSRGLAGRPG